MSFPSTGSSYMIPRSQELSSGVHHPTTDRSEWRPDPSPENVYEYADVCSFCLRVFPTLPPEEWCGSRDVWHSGILARWLVSRLTEPVLIPEPRKEPVVLDPRIMRPPDHRGRE